MKRLILAITLVLIAGSAFGQPLYSAKFVCGQTTPANIATWNAAPGRYYTAINVHNPNSVVVTIRKRFSVGQPNEVPGALSAWFSMNLPPSRTMQIDCRNIWGHIPAPLGSFQEGFVEIRSTAELDVVGVYTVAPLGPAVTSIVSMHMERVPKR